MDSSSAHQITRVRNSTKSVEIKRSNLRSSAITPLRAANTTISKDLRGIAMEVDQAASDHAQSTSNSLFVLHSHHDDNNMLSSISDH
ncbi:unnamed protein product [Coffea canephora]|uniref:Uncharacterized protein n=1 Tax=Coffea canephora TaxID=49390 RepID=A0A068UF58_COFCA|nr:unnamed protein product [Coffea canephora]